MRPVKGVVEARGGRDRASGPLFAVTSRDAGRRRAGQETLAEYESREDAAAAEIETLHAIAKQLRHELAIPEVP